MARRLALIATPLLVFALAVGVFRTLGGEGDPGPARPDLGPAQLIALGDVELQRARETADPTHHAKAEAHFRRVLAREPRDVDALVGLGTVAMAAHEFRRALRFAQRARAAAPGLARPYAVLVDAQIELGRYDAAGRSLQAMIDLRPNLPSYARASYFRELHGDLDGAAEAMRLAVSAGGQGPENVAYVQTLLGDLHALRGDPRAARRAYATALAQRPGYVPARVASARLDAAEGRLDEAIAALRRIVARRPLPEYVVALGEAELADGRRSAARATFAGLRPLVGDLLAGRARTEVDVTLAEADHGSPRRAVQLARLGWAEAPSVGSADALAWALHRAGEPTSALRWARRAVRLGSRDPLMLTRAGLIARSAGRPQESRRYLRRALQRNPRFSSTWAPRARAALADLEATTDPADGVTARTCADTCGA